MNMGKRNNPTFQNKRRLLNEGKAVTCSNSFLDWLSAHYGDDLNELASAYNTKSTGPLADEFVAWIGSENKPGNMEYREQFAYASID